MTCREFQRRWDELLDADARSSATAALDVPAPSGREAAPSIHDRDATLLAHAATCPACRPIAARYQVLREAIKAWKQPPIPPADLVHRILSVPDDPTPRKWSPARPRVRWYSLVSKHQRALLGGLAASALVGFLVTIVLDQVSSRALHDQPIAAIRHSDHDLHAIAGSNRSADDRRALHQILAEATSATWDLARSASEPAARFSRDVLDATTRSETGEVELQRLAASNSSSDSTDGHLVPMPSLDPLTPDPGAATAVLQQVGDQLSAGVRPLSSTARHAFGFLLGPPPERAGSRNDPPAPRGA